MTSVRCCSKPAAPLAAVYEQTCLCALHPDLWTAYAAQLQSKAGDQWSYFQAKRLRGVMQRNTLDLLRSTTTVRPLDAAARRELEQRVAGLHEVQVGLYVHAHGAAPDLGADVLDRLRGGEDARVQHQHVNTARGWSCRPGQRVLP